MEEDFKFVVETALCTGWHEPKVISQLTAYGGSRYYVLANLCFAADTWRVHLIGFRGPGGTRMTLKGAVEVQPMGWDLCGSVEHVITDVDLLKAHKAAGGEDLSFEQIAFAQLERWVQEALEKWSQERCGVPS